MKKLILLLRLVAAGILLQTLFFKFTGAEESIYIFSTLGVEPYGRYFAGFSELIAAILILLPATQAIGALMASGIMAGALLSHVLFLGIEVKGDGGLLFILAIVVLVSSLVVLAQSKQQIFSLLGRLKAKAN